jgi:UDP-N-acetylmuramate dehydrogenase
MSGVSNSQRSISEAATRAVGMLAERAVQDAPLGTRTTYRVGGRATVLVEAHSEEDLVRLAEARQAAAMDVLVVGKGSNLLVADAGFKGIAISLGEEFSRVDIAADGAVIAGGATAYPVLARTTARSGLTGLEWAVGVPGSVGGAVKMNAGGHGSTTAERLVSARIFSLESGMAREVATAELDLSYRHSAVGTDDVVTGASFRLDSGEPQESARQIAEIVAWRRRHQPGGRNAGSIFQNPPGDSAGRLVEAAGAKGLRLGSAEVSTKHANFIQADEGGSADDVHALIEKVRELVFHRLGVVLATEVVCVGFEQ